MLVPGYDHTRHFVEAYRLDVFHACGQVLINMGGRGIVAESRGVVLSVILRQKSKESHLSAATYRVVKEGVQI